MKKTVIIVLIGINIIIQLYTVCVTAYYIGSMKAWTSDVYEEILSIDSRLEYIKSQVRRIKV